MIFDIDGTLTKGEVVGEGIQQYFDKPFSYANMLDYSIVNEIVRQGLITTEQKKDFDLGQFFIDMEDVIFKNADMIEGAVDFVHHLDSKGVNLLFVTARPKKLKQLTQEHFVKNNLGKFVDKIVMNQDGKHGKLNYANKYFNNEHVTIFEDKPSTLEEFHNYGHTIVKVNQPYNAHLSFAERFLSIDNYSTDNLYEYVELTTQGKNFVNSNE